MPMSLEKDLEHIMEQEEEQKLMRDAKRRRSDPTRPSPTSAPGCSNVVTVSRSAASAQRVNPGASFEDQLAKLDADHAAAMADKSQAEAAYKHHEDAVQALQARAQELVESRSRIETEMSQTDRLLKAMEGQLIWLKDIAAKCVIARDSNQFSQEVMEEFSKCLPHHEGARDLQAARVRDAESTKADLRAQRQAICNSLGDNERQLANEHASVAQAEDEVRAAQAKVDRYSSLIKQTKARAEMQRRIDEQTALLNEAQVVASQREKQLSDLQTHMRRLEKGEEPEKVFQALAPPKRHEEAVQALQAHAQGNESLPNSATSSGHARRGSSGGIHRVVANLGRGGSSGSTRGTA
mmetsp:Transcript_123803/g.214638  ORF Transcript_123803/g.214638 Transcript_123803/m.214638 type:complete len:352 (+) Transcript_123803:69-1124(+)